jgi:hypothetical protein
MPRAHRSLALAVGLLIVAGGAGRRVNRYQLSPDGRTWTIDVRIGGGGPAGRDDLPAGLPARRLRSARASAAYSFFFSCPWLAWMNSRISSACSSSLPHCSW